MVQEILPNLFRVEIPLPGSPLKALNSYVILSEERCLIIDTGFDHEECRQAMLAGLARLGVDLARADFFVTHFHIDHLGLLPRLAAGTSRCYLSRRDAETLRAWSGWEPLLAYAIENGFAEGQARASLAHHPAIRYGPDQLPALTLTADGDTISVGDFCFRCLETPGHTRGHTCLYEPTRKLLIAGDHVLADISPTVQCWSDSDNPLQRYLASLDRVHGLEIALTLPGHRRLLHDPRQRIAELKLHHRRRAEEVLQILEQGPGTAFQVAARMSWDIACASWDEFPFGQKWFALGESIAHLRYLEEQGTVCRSRPGDTVVFARIAGRLSP